MPHRKIIKKLAEIHKEQEKQKKNNSNDLDEYPDDFEESEDDNNYNIFAAIEEKRKKNLFDLVQLCENQLQIQEKQQEKTEGKFYLFNI